jgi:hypothetical protein
LNHNAPSVDFPVGRFFMDAWMGVFLSVICAAAFGLSCLWGDFTGWRAVLFASIWVLFSLSSIHPMRGTPSKSWLSWDGHTWQIESLLPVKFSEKQLGFTPESMVSEAPVHAGYSMEVHLDIQEFLFVSLFDDQGFRQWFWISKQSFPDRWHGFRCAVYS